MPHLVSSTPRIVVIGVGGAGGNAVNNMAEAGLPGVHFVSANTDAQALATSKAENRIQLGGRLTEGLGAGSNPAIGEAAAEEALDEINAQIAGAHILFIAAGMGGGTGTGAAYVIARAAKELSILTIAVVTKPFQFEGSQRMRNADAGIAVLKQYADTLLVIPNDNLFRVATDRTTFSQAFIVADQVLYSSIACLVDLIVKEGLINLDLADIKAVLAGMGAAMTGTGEASGEQRAIAAAEEAIVNPLLDGVTLKGAKNLLLSITGGRDLTLWEVDEAANRISQEVDPEANIIVGATLDGSLGDKMRVSIVASGMPIPEHAEAGSLSDAAVWTPRPLTVSESFGGRSTDAISERSPRGKGRSANGKGRAKLSDVEKNRDLPSEQASVSRAKGTGGAKRRAPTQGLQPEPMQQSMAHPKRTQSAHMPEGSGPVGWPEHWAKAGESADGVFEPTMQRPVASASSQAQAPARRGTLFQRLAGLVNARRAG